MTNSIKEPATRDMSVRSSRAKLKTIATKLFADPIATVLAKVGLTPNLITCMGLLGSIGAGAVIAYGHLVIGGILVLIFGAFDMLDGTLARKTGAATKFGAFLDSVFDRLSEAAVLGGLLAYELSKGDSVEALLVLVFLTASFMVSYLRARAEGLDINNEVGILTRPERVAILAVGLMSGFLLAFLCILVALTAITAAQRFILVADTLGKAKNP